MGCGEGFGGLQRQASSTLILYYSRWDLSSLSLLLERRKAIFMKSFGGFVDHPPSLKFVLDIQGNWDIKWRCKNN